MENDVFTCASNSEIVLIEASLTPILKGKQSNHNSNELILSDGWGSSQMIFIEHGTMDFGCISNVSLAREWSRETRMVSAKVILLQASV